MPMSETVLGPAIAAAVSGLSPAQKSDLNIVWTEIAKAILTHIKTQGVVTTVGSPTTQTGTIA